MTKTVLVTGGAGYIGSITVRSLLKQGYKVVVIDNLSTGHRDTLPGDAVFYEANFSDKSILSEINNNHNIRAIIHFAAHSLVSESMKYPHLYYRNNFIRSANLLEWGISEKIDNFIFSSSAAVYGSPDKFPIPETQSANPENPYGESKRLFEKVLEKAGSAGEIKYVSLRYFNVAGADTSSNLGENHDPETHLIPNLIKTALDPERNFHIFGNDFPTPDGTAIRDYIHVLDVADAHIRAMEWLNDSDEDILPVFNIGTGRGFSVMEILRVVEKVSGKQINHEIKPRRQGDPAKLVADNNKIKSVLNWTPHWTNIEEIVRMAYTWHCQKVN